MTAAGPLTPDAHTSREARDAYLDNLKFVLVAVIIVGHGAAAYGSLESAWPYQDVQETQLGGVADSVLATVVIPAALFAMGLFFLISGLVSPASMARRGPRAFARARLVRLGVPLLFWTLLIWPGVIWMAHLAADDRRSFWWQVAHGDPFLDTGPMWFVGVLLIFSLAYAAWCRWTDRGRVSAATAMSTGPDAPLSGVTLVLVAAAISLATVLVRPVLPAASGQVGQSHLWQWPQFVALFVLGIAAARRGWLDPVPERLRRQCGFAALGSISAFLAVAGLIAALGVDGDVIFDPGLHWPALALAALEGPMAIGTSVWLLGVAQLRLAFRPGPLGQAMVRSAYGAFILQGLVLTTLMIALRPIEIPAELKALAVAGLGAVGSFALAWGLISQTKLGRFI